MISVDIIRRFDNSAVGDIWLLWPRSTTELCFYWLILFCRWNQLDIFIVILSIVGIILEEMKTNVIPINPTIIRVMRVLRIARGETQLGSYKRLL